MPDCVGRTASRGAERGRKTARGSRSASTSTGAGRGTAAPAPDAGSYRGPSASAHLLGYAAKLRYKRPQLGLAPVLFVPGSRRRVTVKQSRPRDGWRHIRRRGVPAAEQPLRQGRVSHHAHISFGARDRDLVLDGSPGEGVGQLVGRDAGAGGNSGSEVRRAEV